MCQSLMCIYEMRDIDIGKVLLIMEPFKYLALSVVLLLGSEMDRS